MMEKMFKFKQVEIESVKFREKTRAITASRTIEDIALGMITGLGSSKQNRSQDNINETSSSSSDTSKNNSEPGFHKKHTRGNRLMSKNRKTEKFIDDASSSDSGLSLERRQNFKNEKMHLKFRNKTDPLVCSDVIFHMINESLNRIEPITYGFAREANILTGLVEHLTSTER